MPSLDFFLHNWAKRTEVESRWMTDVGRSYFTDQEDRRSLASKPRRSLLVVWQGRNQNETARMLMQLMRSENESIEVPLYSDVAAVTNAAGAFINGAAGAFSNRRFQVGKKLIIVSADLQTLDRRTILSVASAQLVMSSPLAGVYTTGAFVLPIMDTLPALDHTGQWLTDDHGEFKARFREVVGSASLDHSGGTFGDAPAGWPTVSGVPVLNLGHNWVAQAKTQISRQGASLFSGKAPFVELAGARPILTFNLQFSPLTRSEFQSLLEFFDTRRGRCLPFWILNPASLFTATQAAGATVRIQALENAGDLTDFIDYVAVEQLDGTIEIRLLSSVNIISATEWDLVPLAPFTATPLADIRRVTSGHFARFSNDAMVESWSSDAFTSINLSVVEILNEQTIDVADL